MIIRHNFYVLAVLFAVLCGLSQTKEIKKTQQRELFNPFHNVIGKHESNHLL